MYLSIRTQDKAIFSVLIALFLCLTFIVIYRLLGTAKKTATHPSQTVTLTRKMKHRGELVVVCPPELCNLQDYRTMVSE